MMQIGHGGVLSEWNPLKTPSLSLELLDSLSFATFDSVATSSEAGNAIAIPAETVALLNIDPLKTGIISFGNFKHWLWNSTFDSIATSPKLEML